MLMNNDGMNLDESAEKVQKLLNNFYKTAYELNSKTRYINKKRKECKNDEYSKYYSQ